MYIQGPTCYITAQHKILKAVNFADFAVSLQNAVKMNGQLVTSLNYACNPRIYFPHNQNFNKSMKFVAHEYICAVQHFISNHNLFKSN